METGVFFIMGIGQQSPSVSALLNFTGEQLHGYRNPCAGIRVLIDRSRRTRVQLSLVRTCCQCLVCSFFQQIPVLESREQLLTSKLSTSSSKTPLSLSERPAVSPGRAFWLSLR